MIEEKVLQSLTPVFNGEVYLSLAPTNAKLPRAVFFVVSQSIGLVLGGPNDYRQTSVQIDCWARTAQQALEYANKVFNSLFDEKELFTVSSAHRLADTHDETLNIYSCRWEYSLQT